jgi:large subunit ribosomal protein L24
LREFLTGLAILICLVLITAMVGPHFVDWNGRRAFFEERLTLITGQPVRIEGDISLTILPTPSLWMEQVRIGSPDGEGFVPFEAERIAGALSATSLIRGDIVITEAAADRPILRLAPGEGGRDLAARWPGDSLPVTIERLSIRDGTMVLQRPGREALTVSEILAEIEATSLMGPAKGSGRFIIDGSSRTLRMAVGRVEQGKARIKVLIEDLTRALRLDVEGQAAGFGSAPVFDGTVSVIGNPALDGDGKVQLPFRTLSKARYGGGRLELDDISVTLGQEPMPLALAGQGSVRFGAQPFVDLRLEGRSYDFDRPGPDGRPKLAVPADLVGQVLGLGGGGTSLAAFPEGRLDLSVGGIIAGGQTVTAARAVVEHRAGQLLIEALEGELPGQTQVRFERDSLSRAELVNGVLSFTSRDPERLHGWFNGVSRQVTATASVSAQAVLSTTRHGVIIDRIEIDRGETHLSGDGSYLLALPGLRPLPRLVLGLASPRLAIEDIPAYAIGAERREEKPDLDFEVTIDAGRLVLDGRETGTLNLRARRDGAIVSLERLALTDVDGADLIASGTLGAMTRRITLKLDAPRLDGIAAIVEQVFPGEASHGLRRRAAHLAPALLVGTLSNDDSDDSYRMEAEGRLAGTTVKAGGALVTRNDLDLDLTLALDNPDGVALGRQLFAGSGSGASTLPGMMRLNLKGNLRGAVLLGLETGLAGTTSRIDGHIRLFQPFAPFEGVMTAHAPDLAAAAPVLGLDPALAPANIGLRASARIEGNLRHVAFYELRMLLGGMPIQGEIAFRLADGGKIAGQIKLPAVDLGMLAGVAFGRVQMPLAGEGWSAEMLSKPFSLPLAGDLWIEAERGIIDATTRLEAPKFVLRFEPNAVGIEYGEARLAGGRLTGEVSLKRIGVAGYLTARAGFKDINIARLWPLGPTAAVEGEMQLAGRGESMAKVVQSLSGNGNVRLRQFTLAGFDPGGLGRLLAVPLDKLGALEAANISKRLETELAAGPLSAADLRLNAVAIDGSLRLAGAVFEQAGVRLEGGGSLDLVRRSIDARLSVMSTEAPSGWRGVPPQFTAQWRGPVAGAGRSLAVDTLVSSLLATALNRDIERNDIFEQDMRERSFFNRRLRAAEDARRRAEELNWSESEQLRRQEQGRLLIEEQARRARAEEEARRSVEASNAAPAALPADPAARPRPVQPRPALPRTTDTAPPTSTPPGAPLDLTAPMR